MSCNLGIGAGYIHNIITQRLSTYIKRTDVDTSGSVNLVQRKMFNPNGVSAWFSSIVAIINQLALLTIVLTGAAVIREREHGTLEHLLMMPLTPFEIAMAKVVANGLVILVATMLSLVSCYICSLQRHSAYSSEPSRDQWLSSRCSSSWWLW